MMKDEMNNNGGEYMETAVSYRQELTGVFGYPVDENPTVVMMEAAFRSLGLPWRYLTLKVSPADLATGIQGIRAMGFRGLNLTIPHKVEVLQYLDEVNADARIMGAVNTIYRDQGRLIGANTDGKGFLRALRDDAHMDPSGRKFMLLGAGGAARSISVELALAGAAEIAIVNRNEVRARELVDLLGRNTKARVFYRPWSGEVSIPEDVDGLVNATSIGLYPNIEELPSVNLESIRPGLVVCDVIPNPPRTRFIKEAEARGAVTLDGLGMLVYQGAIAFKLWTGMDAPIEVMKQSLLTEFGVG
jgi:shikimate dehydrogenase